MKEVMRGYTLRASRMAHPSGGRFGYDSETEIIRNLEDAGCGADTITAFVEDIRQGRMSSGQKLLEIHRRSLLDELHKAQKHIDCLDYLIWQMNKQD